MTRRERQWQPVLLGGNVPPPAGAYSPAVRAGGFVFVSGQVPRDPVSGELVGDHVESQTRQVLANVQRALEAAGASLADVVSMVVYLADVDDWGKFNSVYKEVMPAPYPTRTAVGANLRGITIEISAVAYVGKRS
ncbi:MAG TPA: RidA family protein [Gemmatimonadaceae bacterium]|jgi:2-iminobutanoate/2-iminopropanoate deaminase|nr:RidA family protein [Gemmatimonadaceae bacterium]